MYFRHNLPYQYPEKSDAHMIEVKHLRDVVLDQNYPYLQKSFWFKCQRGLLRICQYTVLPLVMWLRHGLHIHGKEKLKQYKELFNLDDVELEFDDGALSAIAEKTLEKKTGARGLRSIIEKTLLPIMYDVPSDPTVERVCITAASVNESAEPMIERNPNSKRAKLAVPPKVSKPKSVS